MEGFKFYQGLLNTFNPLDTQQKQLDKKATFKTQEQFLYYDKNSCI